MYECSLVELSNVAQSQGDDVWGWDVLNNLGYDKYVYGEYDDEDKYSESLEED